MKNIQWKKVLPHIIAIGIFLIVAVLYGKPALQGEVLQQTDIIHWKGMAQSAFDHKAKTGHYPLWNTNLFGGMPNYQVFLDGKSFLFDFNKVLALGLPKPISYFFLACLCFYILCMVLETNYLIAILGSLAYAYSTYNPVIISVGHESKMMAIAYMPALLAGLILLYERKYIAGLCITAFFATMEIGANHPQINYYFIIIAGFMTVAYIIKWVKAKDWKHMGVALGLALICGLIGAGNAAITLLTTAEYAKYTMRGGKTLESVGNTVKEVKTTGLDENYAFAYSIGKSETAVLMMPNAFGGSSAEHLDENSKVAGALIAKGIPEENAQQLAQSLPKYWGSIADVGGNAGTSGPPYTGAVICILFAIGAVIVKSKHRWWIVGASLFAILMAWGSYFIGFNEVLFKVLPLYDKFRAPSMALVIPQLLFPLLAVLCLQELFYNDAVSYAGANFKKILYAVGGVFVVLILIYLMNDYHSGVDDQIKQAYNNPQSGDLGTVIVNALMDDRKAMFSGDLLRLLLFSAAVIGAIFLYIKKVVKPALLVILLTVISTADLLSVDTRYLNSTNYQEAESYEGNFSPDAGEQQILKDKDPHFRVYNLAPDRFQESLTAYYLRSIGGYHPAKLSIYQDLIENQISKGNTQVLNMLDTKYFLMPPQQQQQQSAAPAVQLNDSAMGACWYVNEVKFVHGPAEEMKALNNFNAAQTAFVDDSFKPIVNAVSGTDATAKISLASYDADDIKYTSRSSTNRFAVFSEVYYPAGWNAYIDGKKTGYCKANYVLRGMSIPAGNHAIEFKFEPASYYMGQTIVYITSAALWLCIAAGLFYWWRYLNRTVTGATIKGQH